MAHESSVSFTLAGGTLEWALKVGVGNRRTVPRHLAPALHTGIQDGQGIHSGTWRENLHLHHSHLHTLWHSEAEGRVHMGSEEPENKK